MRELLQGDFRMTAQTLHGLEPVLMHEIQALGGRDIKRHKRAVSFLGDLGTMYKMNLNLRTALRILVPFHTFNARNNDDLYHRSRKYPWEDIIPVDGTFSLGVKVNSRFFDHSQYAMQRVKDGIADRFRHKEGRRPSVDKETPDVRIHIYINKHEVLLSLDSSGESLHKRGYRSLMNRAPINEALAAGMVLLTGWDGAVPFVDPMCGSGTILIEAAMIGARIPPGYFRDQFGFERWSHFDEELWEKLYDKAMGRVTGDVAEIIGGELSRNVHRKARSNVKDANMEELIEVRHSAFDKLQRPEGERGTMIINPPYGERMDKDDLHELYKMIGDTLKANWQGYDAWVITSNLDAARSIKLTPRPKYQLFNGALDCRFMRYEIYSGSRRGGKPDSGQ